MIATVSPRGDWRQRGEMACAAGIVHTHGLGVTFAMGDPNSCRPLARPVQLPSTMDTIQTMGTLSIAMGLLFACEHTDSGNANTAAPGTNMSRVEPLGATSPQAAGADATIVEQLSTARCDREQSCNNIGGGQKYVSRNVCMEQMRGSMANDLNTYDCPRGIDRNEVEHCMLAIKNEECSHPLDTITRMEKCRTGALCMK